MDLLLLLEASPVAFATVVALFGLLIGSFLNVVIYRLPILMERTWSRQCQELLELDASEATGEHPFNLVRPGSSCPRCGHRIRAIENIPVVSYLALKGRCAACREPIPVRYPLIELVTAIASVVIALHFGFSLQAAAALGFTWAIIPLCVIDYDRQLLPDNITLPLLWAGLALSLWGVFVDTHASIIGALAGYLSLWSIFHLFKLATGKEGMGYGDFKLLAALGAWLGWQHLHIIILLSAVVGAIVGISMMAFRKHERSVPIPFGPFLAAAGWITMLWGADLWNAYLDYFA